MNTILAINTAGSKTEIALLSEKGQKLTVLSQKSWRAENNEAERLMPEIDKLYVENQRNFNDTTSVFAISGPGSFTALRVGITTANTIAHLVGAKLYSINTFEYFWRLLKLKYPKDFENLSNTAALLIFAGSRGLYLSKSENDIDENSVEILNINDVSKNLNDLNTSSIFGDFRENQKEVLKDFQYIDIDVDLAEVFKSFWEEGFLVNTPLIIPKYIKKPDITLSKKNIFKD